MSVGMRRIYAPSNPAGPALIKRRLLIEFVCEPDSKLSATMLEQGRDAIRVHKESFDRIRI